MGRDSARRIRLTSGAFSGGCGVSLIIDNLPSNHKVHVFSTKSNSERPFRLNPPSIIGQSLYKDPK